MRTLGIDTSNYTTSTALFDGKVMLQQKKLLPVKEGERGLRQSDAVFHHTVQLCPLAEELFKEAGSGFDAVGVSSKPRNADGSYMPCFCVGQNVARTLAASSGKPVFEFSHQCGHIAAALFSCGKFDELSGKEFIAFHVSGGTTEMLYVIPDRTDFFNCRIIGATSDLNAGQVIDRVGVMLGLKFPCGAQLERLALQSDKIYSPKIFFKDGNVSLSGVENKCTSMIAKGDKPCDVARFAIDCISSALSRMTEFALHNYGSLPLIYAGGVMSDSIIQDRFRRDYGGCFARPEYSCDNAAGIALMAFERSKSNA